MASCCFVWEQDYVYIREKKNIKETWINIRLQ